MHWFLAVERRLTRTALELAIIAMALVVALTFYQVVTRFVLGHPSAWSEVAARSAMIWMVFLGLAAAFRMGSMIAVDLLVDLSPPAMRRIVHMIVGVASLVFLAILIWYGTAMALRVRSQNLAGMSITIAWVYAALPAGSALALFGVIARMMEVWREPAGAHDDELKNVEGSV
ncbi:TRAP transporter small permease [Pararhizobium haloflavum]|uniref:TRAP transporter small permease n=1 Tax=Pararhizobium haloflavum TaxID=2037914 RepID=UPI000C18EE22|nr:TRAP transporter small permease [Pararhizobium haloflavum]